MSVKNLHQNSGNHNRSSPDNQSQHYSSNHNDQHYKMMKETDSRVENAIEAKQMMLLGQKLSKVS